ncbi:MAG TPA: MBL fold metallo-hydrolase [Micromonosporaceae bacterium]|nr:MBL fold metallo-hydrolase [Micromonosporaceae bacterium]
MASRKALRDILVVAATAVAAGAGAAAASWTAHGLREAIGGTPTGARGERVRRSPQYRAGAFHNAAAIPTMEAGSSLAMARELIFGRQRRTPSRPVPIVRPAPGGDTPDGLHVTWYGHASALVELDGGRVLIDPVWSERCSPSPVVGPRRLHPPPVALEDLPVIDAIVISHDHYDHLDLATVRTLVRTQRAPFLVPLGVGAHLDHWGVPADRIVELDWDERFSVGNLELVATAAQHFSGRGVTRDGTLWASWVIAGPTRRVFYTGDSGYFDGYAAIGAAHGPFDVSLIQIGAYGATWPHIHMFPEEAVRAHLDLRGGLLIPVHWGTFNLAFHAWSEPVDRLWLEVKARAVTMAVPRPGERIDVDDPPPVDGWWQAIA